MHHLAELAKAEVDRLEAYIELVEALEFPVWVKEFHDPEPPRMLWFNAFARRLWEVDNYEGKTDFEGWPKEAHGIAREWWDQERDLVASGERTRVYKTRALMPDGSEIGIHVQRSLLNSGSRVMGFAWSPELFSRLESRLRQ